MRRVVLVAGPPCAGKTTYVRALAEHGDVVADFDLVARLLGSPGKWLHSAAVGDAAEREMHRLAAAVGQMSTGVAWVIRCAPDRSMREDLAAQLRADQVVVLLPPLGVLLRRARERPSPDETRRSIWRWLDRWEPSPADEVVTDGSAAEA